jgi:hypothetical protein
MMTAAKPNPIKPDVATLDGLFVTINGHPYKVEDRTGGVLLFTRLDDYLAFGYTVGVQAGTCTCGDYLHRGNTRPCKHIRAARRLRLVDVFRAVEPAVPPVELVAVADDSSIPF